MHIAAPGGLVINLSLSALIPGYSVPVLAAVLLLETVQIAFTLAFLTRRGRARAAAEPSVRVFVPCAGAPGRDLARTVAALLDQDYSGGWEVVFVAPSRKDPSYSALESLLAGRDRARLLSADAAPERCGGKSVNLLAGLRAHGSEAEVLAFTDADLVVPRGWLRALVAPLADPGVAAATSAVHFHPAGLAGTLRSAWMAAGVPYLAAFGVPCGQSLAMRRADFERWDIAALWGAALYEDLALHRALRGRGRVEFVREAAPGCAAPAGLAEVFAMTGRWILAFRVYVPLMWALGFGLTVAKLGALALALQRPAAWGVLLALVGGDALNLGLLAPRGGRLAAVAAPLLPLHHLWDFLNSLLRRELRWGGYLYRIDGPESVRVLPAPVEPPAMFPLALFGGAFMGLTYLPQVPCLLAWTCFIPFFFCVPRLPARTAFLWGLVFGTAGWMTGASWLTGTVTYALHFPLPAAAAAVLGFAMYHALIFALLALWVGALAPRLEGRGWHPFAARMLLAVPALWLLDRHFPGIFPSGLAQTQALWPPALQSMELFGSGAITAVVLAFSCAVAGLLEPAGSGARSRRDWRPLALALLLAGANEAYGRVRLAMGDVAARSAVAEGRALRVAVIQPVLPPRSVPAREARADGDIRLQDLMSQQALESRSDLALVVWPESTFGWRLITAPGGERLRDARFGLRTPAEVAAALPYPADLLINGTSEVRGGPGGPVRRNSAVLLAPGGNLLGVADKRILFPFGEYAPFGDRFPAMRRLVPDGVGLTPGEGSLILRTSRGVRLAVLICYEDFFPGAARAALREDADVLVGLSHDSWFRSRTAVLQHMRHSILRAVENRRPFLRAVNAGGSAAVEASGRVLRSLPVDERGWFTADLPLTRGPAPLGALLPVWDGLAAALMALAAVLVRRPPRGDAG